MLQNLDWYSVSEGITKKSFTVVCAPIHCTVVYPASSLFDMS